MTYALCDLTIEDLRHLRRWLLYRYVYTDPKSTIHHSIGEKVDLVSLELVRRTGDKKWKL